jgi:hypothetical protein
VSVVVVSRVHTEVIPKEGQLRFAEKASRSNKFPILWAAGYTIELFSDLEGYLRKLALRVNRPSFGHTSDS